MTRFIGASNNNINGPYALSGALYDEDSQDWVPPQNSYYKRGATGVNDPAGFFSLWPQSYGLSCDPAGVWSSSVGNDNWLNEYAYGLDGQNGQKFIIGTTIDANGVAVQSVVVEAYLTSTNAPAGQTTSGSDGHYEVGTPYTGAHFCVGYLDAATDTAGTTVNTLTPTNRDGT